MLKRIRIEVEEDTAEACVEALNKYEHAIQQQEARRFREMWPVSATLDTRGGTSVVSDPREEYSTPDHDWNDTIAERDFYNSQLGREITDEVIEFDSSLPGYTARRVVVFNRIDMRDQIFTAITPIVSEFLEPLAGGTGTFAARTGSGEGSIA